MTIDLMSLLGQNAMLLLFTVIGVGYLLGNVKIAGIEGGPVVGVLLMGLLFGRQQGLVHRQPIQPIDTGRLGMAFQVGRHRLSLIRFQFIDNILFHGGITYHNKPDRASREPLRGSGFPRFRSAPQPCAGTRGHKGRPPYRGAYPAARLWSREGPGRIADKAFISLLIGIIRKSEIRHSLDPLPPRNVGERGLTRVGPSLLFSLKPLDKSYVKLMPRSDLEVHRQGQDTAGRIPDSNNGDAEGRRVPGRHRKPTDASI